MGICLSLNPPVILGPLATSTHTEMIKTGGCHQDSTQHISFVIYRTQKTVRELSKE